MATHWKSFCKPWSNNLVPEENVKRNPMALPTGNRNTLVRRYTSVTMATKWII